MENVTAHPVQPVPVLTASLSGRLTGHAALYHYSINPVVDYPAKVVVFQISLN